jgi:hypothetical protein
VQAGYARTSIVDTTDETVEIDEPVLTVTEVEREATTKTPGDVSTERYRDRTGEVVKHLRLEHLNGEERKEIQIACLDYHDIFYLPGEILSSTKVVKHKIRLEPGTEPVNARPYRLPKTQKHEIRRQVEELKRGGIITESISPWNSPFLVVPKRRT